MKLDWCENSNPFKQQQITVAKRSIFARKIKNTEKLPLKKALKLQIPPL